MVALCLFDAYESCFTLFGDLIGGATGHDDEGSIAEAFTCCPCGCIRRHAALIQQICLVSSMGMSEESRKNTTLLEKETANA